MQSFNNIVKSTILRRLLRSVGTVLNLSICYLLTSDFKLAELLAFLANF